MKIEITEKRENPLQERTEVRFVVDHEGEATPSRAKVREELAKVLKTDVNAVIIDNIGSQYGMNSSVVYAKIYKDVETAKRLESKYLLTRSGISTAKTEE